MFIHCVYMQTQLPDLCKAIHLGDRRMAEEWKQKDCWATVEQLVTASGQYKYALQTGFRPSTALLIWKKCDIVNVCPHMIEIQYRFCSWDFF